MIEKTAIIGMGALGVLYGTHIMDNQGPEHVCFVMDQERVARNQGKTLYKNGKPYQVPICDSENAKAADLVIVAVKYNSLASALDTMKNCIGENTIVMSVMNGISSEEIIADRYGKEHMIYCVAQGMDAMKFADRLDYTRMGELRIGAKEACQDKNLKEVCDFFTAIAMPYTKDENIMHRLWGKFMLNVGINQCCMVYETTYGVCLREGEEANRTMIAAMREVIALAQSEGIDLSEKDLNEYVAILRTLSPDGVPSMRQDGIAKRRSEVEMFAGTVIELAEKHGLYVPANRFLYKRVHEMEAQLGCEHVLHAYTTRIS